LPQEIVRIPCRCRSCTVLKMWTRVWGSSSNEHQHSVYDFCVKAQTRRTWRKCWSGQDTSRTSRVLVPAIYLSCKEIDDNIGHPELIIITMFYSREIHVRMFRIMLRDIKGLFLVSNLPNKQVPAIAATLSETSNWFFGSAGNFVSVLKVLVLIRRPMLLSCLLAWTNV